MPIDGSGNYTPTDTAINSVGKGVPIHTRAFRSFLDDLATAYNALRGDIDTLDGEAVKTVNGEEPDGSGELTLTPDDVGAEPAWGVDTWTGNGTLELADMRKSWEVEGSATISVPSDATADIPIGYAADFYQVDDGETVDFAAGSGATLLSFDSKVTMAGQNAGATLRKVAADTWRLEGRLS